MLHIIIVYIVYLYIYIRWKFVRNSELLSTERARMNFDQWSKQKGENGEKKKKKTD